MGEVFLNKLTAPREPIYENLSATITAANWENSGITNIIKNDVTFGGVTTTQQTDTYALAFFDNPTYPENMITGNDIANLPQGLQLTFSSLSDTGPITVTKPSGEGVFDNKFIASTMLVFQNEGNVRYVITDVVDDDTMIAYRQPNGSQGSLQNLVNTYGGPNQNLNFEFCYVNGTGVPEVQYVRSNNYEEQQQTGVSRPPGVTVGATMTRFFNVPNNAVSISDFAEMLPGFGAIPDGTRYYALVYDNIAAYVVKPVGGIRKIVRNNNGTIEFNVSDDYATEQWQQGGGSVATMAAFAIQAVEQNRVPHSQWLQVTEFPSLSGVNQITIAMGLADNGQTQGVELTFNIEVVDTSVGFNDENFITLELNIDDGDLSNFGAIKAAWNNGVAYYEVIEPNVIRFYSGFTANEFTVDVPIQVKVIK